MVAIKVAATLVVAMAARSTLIWLTRPVDDGAWRIAQNSSTGKTLAWIVLATAVAFKAGWAEAVVSLAGAFLVVRLLKGFFDWRYGGIPAWGPSAALLLATVTTGVFMSLLW